MEQVQKYQLLYYASMFQFFQMASSLLPTRRRRKELRNRWLKSRERRAALLGYGCQLEGDVGVAPNGIRFDISDQAKIAAHVGEVLVEEVYNFACLGETVIIDIGMNRGLASLHFANKEQVQRIYAFEPFAPTLALARKNLSLNPRLEGKIEAFEYGLGKENTAMSIPYAENVSDLMSTTHAPPDKDNLREVQVQVRDAAEVLRPIFERHQDARIIIKCDCEGAEFDIMERLQAENMVDKIDGVLMEYHFEEPHRLVEILTTAGFAVHYQQDTSKKNIVGLLYAIKIAPK
jgi:FkbM family methyltransferase